MNKLMAILLLFLFNSSCKTFVIRKMIVDSTIVRNDTSGFKVIKRDSIKTDTIRSYNSHTTTTVLRLPRYKQFNVLQIIALAAIVIAIYFLRQE